MTISERILKVLKDRNMTQACKTGWDCDQYHQRMEKKKDKSYCG